MDSSMAESAPLLPKSRATQRTVTFNPVTTAALPSGEFTAGPSLRPPADSSPAPAFQLQPHSDKLRRRSIHTSTLSPQPILRQATPKAGPQRTSKTTQKLKLLPNPDLGGAEDEESGRDVYVQYTRIKDPTARRDAARLGKADRDRLPRVTAYATAGSYKLEEVMRFFKSRARMRAANPKQFDECIYSTFNYNTRSKENDKFSVDGFERPLGSWPVSRERRYSDSAVQVGGELANGPSETATTIADTYRMPWHDDEDLDLEIGTPEVFLFEYGTVVIWGMTLGQEERFLRDITKFELEKLPADEVQSENFNFYYTRKYQPRIYNDFISLREKHNHMTKLAISHALSQSVKTSLFEDMVSVTIASTASLPNQIAETGSADMSRRQINMRIGELFTLKISIHLQGSVLDSPELMWAEPHLEPTYTAVREYLEMDQRTSLLNQRLDVISDLLTVLKDQLSHRHSEYLEWIVIILIAAEILVAAINIVVDLYAGID